MRPPAMMPRGPGESGTHQSKHAAGRSCRFHGLSCIFQNDINTYNLTQMIDRIFLTASKISYLMKIERDRQMGD